MPECPPVLLIIFNRPETTDKVFARIREIRPKHLYIGADGPRSDVEGEDAKCRKARKIVDGVDWPCEVKTLFREKNLGCRKAVSESITWFFENVNEGIILEDDCLPDPSFFDYCSNLLERYKDDTRIMCISGSNFQNGEIRGDGDYYYSIFPHCWGWATWRRAWNLYDSEMSSWPSFKEQNGCKGLLPHSSDIRRFQGSFQNAADGILDSWGYVWLYSCWSQNGLTCLPQKNLVQNVGFSSDATRTGGEWWMSIPAEKMISFKAPTLINPNTTADNYTLRNHHKIEKRESKKALLLRLLKEFKLDIRDKWNNWRQAS
ncbi:hypothetical protein [Rubellicoccus peritrichatus]|uniref:Hemolytic protein HlpA-like protein n=1 Tax=Rubellicoccus peritrichatus TaxID=3080537 RepID=A0AAQ3LG05_9BACT|nr:hypothetical protein [Puniceicoccus sp. CR14]WOO41434.1 hypothetical protein RZN69_22670 [Puniceicoccus sp. CR14]